VKLRVENGRVGDPYDKIVLGNFEGKRVAFLARHGRGHRIIFERSCENSAPTFTP